MAEENTEKTAESAENKGAGTEVQQEAFDPKAFTAAAAESIGRNPVVTDSGKNQGGEEEKKNTVDEKGTESAATTEEEEDEIHLNNEFTWDQRTSSASKEESSATEKDKSTDEKFVAVEEKEKGQSAGANDLIVFAKELGIEAKDPVELKEKITAQQKELSDLRELLASSSTTPEIESLKPVLKWEDEKLVRHDLKVQGLDEEIINDEIERLKETGGLKVEAQKVRVQINKFIGHKQQEKLNADRQLKEAEAKANQENLKSLREAIDKTDELFGYKIAAPENLKKTRDEHYNYLASGKFLNDALKDANSIVEISFLWRNRETILKVLNNKAKAAGKREVLNRIQNTVVDDPGRINLPQNNESGEPDLAKFAAGLRGQG